MKNQTKNKESDLNRIGATVNSVVNLFGIPEYLLKDFMSKFIDFIADYKSKNNL